MSSRRIKKRSKTCPICNKDFNPFKKDSVFCSYDCSVRGRNGNTRYSKVTVSCWHCAKKFLIKKSKKIKRNFCSQKCYHKYIKMKNIFSDEKNPNCKINNEVLLGIWEEWKKSKSKYPRKIFQKYGYKGLPLERLKRLVGEKEFKEFYVDRLKDKTKRSRNNYRRGYMKERDCCLELIEEGYYAWRSPGSRGVFDVYAVRSDGWRLIQIKRTIDLNRNTPKHFKKDYQATLNFPYPPSSRKEFWIWIDNVGWFKYFIDKEGKYQSLKGNKK